MPLKRYFSVQFSNIQHIYHLWLQLGTVYIKIRNSSDDDLFVLFLGCTILSERVTCICKVWQMGEKTALRNACADGRGARRSIFQFSTVMNSWRFAVKSEVQLTVAIYFLGMEGGTDGSFENLEGAE